MTYPRKRGRQRLRIVLEPLLPGPKPRGLDWRMVLVLIVSLLLLAWALGVKAMIE